MHFYSDCMKRTLDVVSALSLLLLSLPFLLVVSAIVAINLGLPVFFRQIRPGMHSRPFTLIKFRSMRDLHDSTGRPLADADRLTAFGKFLRGSSIDELPELWNVLKGDMSLVGPRPLLMEYLPLYSADQARRHDVRPGITGWAQVNGRNALSWEEKFELDVWYVDNRSALLDLKILAMTCGAVLFRRGISNDGHATMPPFRGKAG
jgi:sugar transferase EpsL